VPNKGEVPVLGSPNDILKRKKTPFKGLPSWGPSQTGKVMSLKKCCQGGENWVSPGEGLPKDEK